EAHRLISLSSGLGDPLGNRLENSLEPFGLNAAQRLSPKNEVSDSANRLRRFRALDHPVEEVVARCQSTSRSLKKTAVMQLLKYVEGGEDRFSMFFWSSLHSSAQLSDRVLRRNFQRNWL